MHRRISLAAEPLPEKTDYAFMNSPWPARWVGPRDYLPGRSEALVFRREFRLAKRAMCRVHISADQRYELSVDGQYVGRGVERSDLKNWVYESYELDLKPGRHRIVVRLWWVAPGAPAPEAQQTHRPALLVYGEGQANGLFSTGVVKWQYRRMPGYRFADHDRLHSYFATGAQLQIDGREVDAQVEQGSGGGWEEGQEVGQPALASLRWESAPWWILRPAFLPPMYERRVTPGKVRHVEAVGSDKTDVLPVKAEANIAAEQQGWARLLRKGERLVVPANSRRRVIIDLENYYCAYPEIRCRGEGAYVRVQFAESLYHVTPGQEKRSGNPKGNRSEIEGKCFYGVGIEITAGSKAFTYSPHSFLAGRYVEIYVRTGRTPLILEAVTFLETHFPFAFKARFVSDDPAHAEVIPVALRTLEMCSHDTSMDCPYYERLNYVGDTRLQSLIAYVAADEQRLAEKCIQMFDVSRQHSGLTYSRYPTRMVQTIPTFSLWWVGMVYDYALWRSDRKFVADRMVGVRSVIESWRRQLRENGLFQSPAGWNFVDWVRTWHAGIPAGGNGGFSGIINLQAVYTLKRAAELEEFMGEPLLAQRNRELADDLARSVARAFYDRKRKLFADDLKHTLFSEHAQCMAVLSGAVAGAEAGKLADRMLAAEGLAQTTIYFSHYLFETLGQTGRIVALLERLKLWESLKANGLCTTVESPEPSRSDCHAWGAHPVYHFLATLAGIRPAGFGFSEVSMRPQLGTLGHIEGEMPHRLGPIVFSFDQPNGKLSGRVVLPRGLTGRLELPRGTRRLKSGPNVIG